MLIASESFRLVKVAFDGMAHRRALWQPQGQTGSDERIGVIELELAADFLVIFHFVPLKSAPASASPPEYESGSGADAPEPASLTDLMSAGQHSHAGNARRRRAHYPLPTHADNSIR